MAKVYYAKSKSLVNLVRYLSALKLPITEFTENLRDPEQGDEGVVHAYHPTSPYYHPEIRIVTNGFLHLQRLHLHTRKLHKGTLCPLRKLHHLIDLRLSAQRGCISSGALSDIANYAPHLRRLDISGATACRNLDTLRLNELHTLILDDVSLTALPKNSRRLWPSLRVLSCQNTRISVKSLSALVPQLESLFIYGSNVLTQLVLGRSSRDPLSRTPIRLPMSRLQGLCCAVHSPEELQVLMDCLTDQDRREGECQLNRLTLSIHCTDMQEETVTAFFSILSRNLIELKLETEPYGFVLYRMGIFQLTWLETLCYRHWPFPNPKTATNTLNADEQDDDDDDEKENEQLFIRQFQQKCPRLKLFYSWHYPSQWLQQEVQKPKLYAQDESLITRNKVSD